MTDALHLTPELVEDPVRGYAGLRARPGLGHAVLPGLLAPGRDHLLRLLADAA